MSGTVDMDVKSVTYSVSGAIFRGSVPEALELCELERVVSYLELFPPSKRATMLSLMGTRPVLAHVLEAIGGVWGAKQLDGAYNLRVCGGYVYLTRFIGECPGFKWGGLWEAAFDLHLRARALRLATPVLTEDPPDGYCYMAVVKPTAQLHVALVHRAYPKFAEVERWITRPYAIETVGAQTHIRAVKEQPVVRPTPEARVGGSSCLHYGPECAGLDVCNFCKMRAEVMAMPIKRLTCDTQPCWDPLPWDVGALRTEPDANVDVLYAPDISPAMRSVPTLPPTAANCVIESCVAVGSEGHDTLAQGSFHHCQAGAKWLNVGVSNWAVEIPAGEMVIGNGFSFRPQGIGGGVLVSNGPMVLGYLGARDALSVRTFSPASFTRFLHKRLGYGVGSMVKKASDVMEAELVYLPAARQPEWHALPGFGALVEDSHDECYEDTLPACRDLGETYRVTGGMGRTRLWGCGTGFVSQSSVLEIDRGGVTVEPNLCVFAVRRAGASNIVTVRFAEGIGGRESMHCWVVRAVDDQKICDTSTADGAFSPSLSFLDDMSESESEKDWGGAAGSSLPSMGGSPVVDGDLQLKAVEGEGLFGY
nr:MAG: hypothetical protein [Aspergillus flavus vivivirus 1]